MFVFVTRVLCSKPGVPQGKEPGRDPRWFVFVTRVLCFRPGVPRSEGPGLPGIGQDGLSPLAPSLPHGARSVLPP